MDVTTNRFLSFENRRGKNRRRGRVEEIKRENKEEGEEYQLKE